MFPLSLLVALLAGLLFFTSCERHHPGEYPEIQQEHTHPLQQAAEEKKAPQPTSPTPADLAPNQKP